MPHYPVTWKPLKNGGMWMSPPIYTRRQKQLYRRRIAKQARFMWWRWVTTGIPMYRHVPWAGWGSFISASIMQDIADGKLFGGATKVPNA